MNIFVSNLNYKVEDEELQSVFAAYGEVASAKIIRDHETGRSRGFGFVFMPNHEEASQAMEALNGADLHGRTLAVNKARPRPQQEGGYAPRRSFRSDD
jgi:RNA recognition motif-containing protein